LAISSAVNVFKSVLRIIESLNNETNRLIEKAVYWLPTFINNNDINSKILLDNLKEKQKVGELIKP
jgi:hypothetical protein